MKSFILIFTFLVAFGNVSNAQDLVNSKNTATERAPKSNTVSDNNGNNLISAYGGRWFGQNAAATSFFARGVLNTTGSLSNFGPGSTSLFGGMEFNNTGTLYCVAVAAGSPLQTLDTVTGVLTTLGAITGIGSEQVLSLSFNKVNNTMYLTTTVTGGDKLYTLDLTTRAATLIGNAGQNFFGIAINSTGQCYAISIDDNLYSINLASAAGTLIGPIGFDANFIQGLSFDRQTDTLWYAAYNNTALRGELRTVNLVSGATNLIAPFTPAAEVCGFTIPSSAPPPPPGGNTLVLVHDSTISSTTQRTADRDTLRFHLNRLVGNYTLETFTATSVLPDLSTYNTIILQETSFDNIAVRYLSPASLTLIKAWLDGGTPANKRSLISIGADQGYNYSRTGSAAQDLVFAGTYCKFLFRIDNGPTSTGPQMIGTGIDAGNTRPLSSTPPGGSFWPDGCSIETGGVSLYKYQNHTASDTVAAIGNIQPNYVVATLFIDPRYPVNEFGVIFKNAIDWVISNGGVITGVNNNTYTNGLNTPVDFSLSQNYPNPFNPSTKINFTIPKSGVVTLKVYNILGKEVAQLVNEFKNAGNYEINFNASNLSSGTYFYRIETNGFTSTKKMSLLK